MSDTSGTRTAVVHGYRVDPYTGAVRMDGGVQAARMVRLMAFAGIAARLFAVYASANRISVSHKLLGLLNSNGELDLTGRADAVALASRADDADGLGTLALVLSMVTIVLYLMALISLGRRGKRGDTVAAAVSSSRGLRIAGRLYLVAGLCAVAVRSAFKPAPDAMPTVRLDDVIGGDVATIGLQLLVITFLLIVALTVGRIVSNVP